MSDVKMCDKCKNMFSVQSNGWTSLGGTQMFRDPLTGKRTPREAEQDLCGPCNGVPADEATYAKVFQGVIEPASEAGTQPRKAITQSEVEGAQAEADMWRAKYEAEKERKGYYGNGPIPETHPDTALRVMD